MMMKKEVFIQSNDTEVAKRLASMLELEGYSSCVLVELCDVFQFIDDNSSPVIVIEWQRACTHNANEMELIRKLAMNTCAQLLIITLEKASAEIRECISSDRIHFLFKPILHTDFVNTVCSLLETVGN